MVSTVIEPERRHTRRHQSRPSAGRPGILIVDDMALTLALLEAELEPCGFSLWLAESGNDAIDFYRPYHKEIDMVLLDVQMPGLDGPLTLAAMQSINPNVVACFMTGNADEYTMDELLDRGALRVFCKPFRPSDVSCFIQQLLCESDPAAFVCDWSDVSACKASAHYCGEMSKSGSHESR